MQILMIADDLTGALDSAVGFAEAGMTCRVARRPAHLAAALAAGPDVLAVSTCSREGSAAAAEGAVAAVFDAVGASRPPLVFKKVDSRLKGHVGAELAVVAARTGIRRALVAPAIPQQGRYTEGGRLAGTGVATPIDVAAVLAGSGLAPEVPDARSDADLDRVLESALDGPPAVLVGAAGLAAALARRLGPGRAARFDGRLPAPLVLAVGSRDPITLAQVEAVRAAGLVDLLPAPDGVLAAPATPPEGRPLLAQLTAGGGVDARTAGARFARSVAGVLAGRPAGSLFGCGGETVDAILGALGVAVLDIEGELVPGVPVSRMVVNGRTTRLVTKSGGFGAPDALISVVRRVVREDREVR